MEEAIDSFFADDFNLTMLCMVAYFVGLIIVETKSKSYKYKDWFKDNWLQPILGLLIVLIMVAKDDVIMEQIDNSGSVWPWWFYLGGGVIVSVVLKIIEYLPKITGRWVEKLFK